VGVEVSASVAISTEAKAANSFSEASESMEIISIGKAPEDNVMKWAQMTEDENMPVWSTKYGVCELVELALDRIYGYAPTEAERLVNPKRLPRTKMDNAELLELGLQTPQGTVPSWTMTERDRVVENCWAGLEEESTGYTSYCKWVQHYYVPSMTCLKPLVVKTDGIAKTAECYDDSECDAISGINRKCINNVCEIKYKRIVDIKISSQDEEADVSCPSNYDVVVIDGRDSNEIKEGCTGSYWIKLCTKSSESPKAEGVCGLKLETGNSCSGGYEDVGRFGESDGNLNQGYYPRIKLCMKKTGCETISGEGDERTFKPAIKALKMTTDDGWACPTPPPGISGRMARVRKTSSLTGDFNENKWCDSVYLCQDEGGR